MSMERAHATSVRKTHKLSLLVLQIFCPAFVHKVCCKVATYFFLHCSIGHYRDSTGFCVDCVEGATCTGGSNIPVASPGFCLLEISKALSLIQIIIVGYWNKDNATLLFLPCIPHESCIGGQATACAVGYVNVRCGACDKSYYRQGDVCKSTLLYH